MKQTLRQWQSLRHGLHGAANDQITVPQVLLKLWARIRVAQLQFDLWYSRQMLRLDERDIELANYQWRMELQKQQDIQASLKKWRAAV